MPLENTFYCCLHLCPKKRPTEYGRSQSKLKFVKVLDSNFLSLEALPPYLSAPRYACGRAREYGESTVYFFFSNEIKWLLPGCSLRKALNTHTQTQTHTDRQTHTHSVYMYTCMQRFAMSAKTHISKEHRQTGENGTGTQAKNSCVDKGPGNYQRRWTTGRGRIMCEGTSGSRTGRWGPFPRVSSTTR